MLRYWRSCVGDTEYRSRRRTLNHERDIYILRGINSGKDTEMTQTPQPEFIERFEHCDLEDFKKEDLDMITREMNILYSKLRGFVTYDATSLEIFLTYLREGNLQLAELFRNRALFELLTIEEDRTDIMLKEEPDLEEGCEEVVQYSEYFFDPEEKEQGPTLLEQEKKKHNLEKINVKERRSKPAKWLRSNIQVSEYYYDPEFESRRKKYPWNTSKHSIRKNTLEVYTNDQRSVITEQRLSPEGSYSTNKDRRGGNTPESRHQNMEIKGTSDQKSPPVGGSNTDSERLVHEEVNNLRPSSTGEKNGSAKPLKEITDNLGSARRRGIVGGDKSPDKIADNLNSVSYVMNEKNNNSVKDNAKDAQVLDEERNKGANAWDPQNTDILNETNINALQKSQRTLDHNEYAQMQDEEKDNKLKQPRNVIDLSNLMGPDMSRRTNHTENDDSSSPIQREFDEDSSRSPNSPWQEVNNTGPDLSILVYTDHQKTTMNPKRERLDDKPSDDNNENMVTQKRDIITKSQKESKEVSHSPGTTKEGKEDTITEKDTYDMKTNTLKMTAGLNDTSKEITEAQGKMKHSSSSLQGNTEFANLTKPPIQPEGNATSSDTTFGLERSTMNSEQMSEEKIDNTHSMNRERSAREDAVNGSTSNLVGVNISSGGLNASGQEKRTDSSMSIWQENKSNTDEPQAKYVSFKNKFQKDARNFDYKDENSRSAMNNGVNMTPDSMTKGAVESEDKENDATESTRGSILVSKDHLSNPANIVKQTSISSLNQTEHDSSTGYTSKQKKKAHGVVSMDLNTNPGDGLTKKNHDEKVTSVFNDQKLESYDTNWTDQTNVLGFRSDLEKERLTTITHQNKAHKTPTRLLSIGSLGTLSPIREGEHITDEKDLKVSTETSGQPYLEEKTNMNDQMEKRDDGTDEMKMSLHAESVDGTLDGSRSQTGKNIEESKYEDNTNRSKEIDSKSQIGDAENTSDPLKQNGHSDNLSSTCEVEKDKVSSDSNKTKHIADSETCIQQESNSSNDSASNGLKALQTGINSDSNGLLMDNSIDMGQSSSSSQLFEERGDSNSLGQEKKTVPIDHDKCSNVDKPQETQEENKNSSQHAVVSKDTNELPSNNLGMSSENSVTLKTKDDIDSVENENTEKPILHVSDEGEVTQMKQSEVDSSSIMKIAFTKRSSPERSVSSQSADLAQTGKDSTCTENPKVQEVGQGLKKTTKTGKDDSNIFKEVKDPSSTKSLEKTNHAFTKTNDKINAKMVLKRVNEKMVKLDQQEETDHGPVMKKHFSDSERGATIDNPETKPNVTNSTVQQHGNIKSTLIKNTSNERAGDESKRQKVHDPQEVHRRSEEASLLLRQGNPNITDLSDNNRPTNLADRFSELYDNEYTDAFEELQKRNFAEKKIACVLLCIVKHAYYFCSERASYERNVLMSVMKNSPAATSDGNPLKTEALRKGIVAQSLKDKARSLSPRICKEFFDSRYQSIIPKEIDSRSQRLLKYAQLCVEIVWWMCVQDPPIYLSWIEETESSEFDKDEYRSYTKSGKTVDFCVWPLVHLCKGGPILAKGIAQGK